MRSEKPYEQRNSIARPSCRTAQFSLIIPYIGRRSWQYEGAKKLTKLVSKPGEPAARFALVACSDLSEVRNVHC